jgi:hypothetical protein
MRLGVSGRTADLAVDDRSGPEDTDFSGLRDSAELRDAEQNARRALGLMPSRQNVQTSNGPGNGNGNGNGPGNGHASNGQGRARRRFARDGDVAVVVRPRTDNPVRSRTDHSAPDASATLSATSPTLNRVAAAETARDAERTARQRAERALAEAQAALRSLQTQVRHAAMTQDEALANARQAVADRDALEAALAVERQARESAEQALAKLLARRQRPAQMLTDGASAVLAPRQPRAAAANGTAETGADPVRKKPARVRGRAPEPKPVKWWVKPRG